MTIVEMYKNEGMQQGMQQGILQGKLEVAKKLLAKGSGLQSIAELISLSMEQISSLQEEALS